MPGLHLGLISGTSADGIDCALVRFDHAAAEAADAARLIAARSHPYPPDLRAELLEHSQADATLSLDAIGRLDHRIGIAFADAAASLMAAAGVGERDIVAVGSHGQTLRHRPTGPTPFTLQLGDPSLIAERLRIPVVADFRRRDLAAGGQGAPLAPAFHAAVLHSADEDRAVLNLGGIANLTLLPCRGEVLGFDSGPANGLMDAWVLRHRQQPYDADGAFAAAGRCNDVLLGRLLGDPYFALPAPKSTGRDSFHLGWLQHHLDGLALAPEDVQATLLELTARSCTEALLAALPGARRLLVCGGGVHNRLLMRRLAARLPDARVESTGALGIDPDFMEAIAFAWLARETLAGRPGNLPSVTGARGPRVLGAIYPA
jgi:anhydro-N-acetylmuramic acid kinase